MKTATVAQARAHLSTLLNEIESGEEVVITRRGAPVARLVAERRSGGFGWTELREWVTAAPLAGPTVAEMRERDLL